MSEQSNTPCTLSICQKRIATLPHLRPGDMHVDVQYLQKYLHHYGYLVSKSDCRSQCVCPKTAEALAKLQSFFHLDENGELDASTRQVVTAARCGVPDFSELEFRTIGAWYRKTLTFAFGQLTTQSIGTDVVRDAVRSAVATWEDVGVGIRLSEVDASASPDVLVEWRPADDSDHSMVGGTLAHADFPPGYSILTNDLPLPLHFDDTEHTWVDGSAPGSFDIQTVALHEFGHILGLLHSNVPGAVMYPSIGPETQKRALTKDDVAALRALYK